MEQDQSTDASSRAGSWARLGRCITKPLKPAMKSALWILAITIPITFAVKVLAWLGVLGWVAGLFAPLFELFGLPGESALVFITSCLLNIYSAIAIIGMLDLSTRVITILALMCLIAHNLFVETAVQKKTGSSLLAMVVVRLSAAFAGGFFLNLLYPADPAGAGSQAAAAIAKPAFGTVIHEWFFSSSVLIAKIIILITLLMILQRILEEFGIIRFLSRFLKYPLVIVGLPVETAFLWIVANTLGLAYGAGVLIDEVDKGKLKREHANILNYHIGVSHSLLEDTALFMAIGVSAWWITLPRVALAGAVVWIRRIIVALRSRQDDPQANDSQTSSQ